MINSPEQEQIIKELQYNKNIIIEAVAGSGKTTTLFLCSNKINKKCVLLTYSRSLCDEIKEKHIPPNLNVYTFHGFASVFYSSVINNDILLNEYLMNHFPDENNKFRDIDILMVDEVQDMNKQYFLLIKIIIELNKNIRLILVGDRAQTIKQYIGAYSEFLTDAERIFKTYTSIKGEWSNQYLTKSYRLTPKNAHFINTHLYKTNYIVPGNTRMFNKKPDYIALPYFISKNKINKNIPTIIRQYINKYSYKNILILASSYRINNPGYLLANELDDIAHCLPSNAEDKCDALLYNNKLIFRTFASCKGLQAKCVIILGLDENYFKYGDREWSDEYNVPNILSVATTRAMEKLVIIASERETLRTFKFPEFYEDSRVLLNKEFIIPFKNKSNSNNNNSTSENLRSVSDFIKHKHPEIEYDALKCINYSLEKTYADYQCAESIIKFDSPNGFIYESVSYLYGILIPKLFELKINNKIIYYDLGEIKNNNIYSVKLYYEYINLSDHEKRKYKKYIKHLFACELLKEALTINSFHIARQISHFDWIDLNTIDNSLAVLDEILPYSCTEPSQNIFEYILPEYKYESYVLSGRIDYTYKNIIYELKYTNALVNEHLLQIGMYLLMTGYICGYILLFPCGKLYKVELLNKNKFIKLLSTKNINNDKIFDDLLREYINVYNVNMLELNNESGDFNPIELYDSSDDSEDDDDLFKTKIF